MIIFTAAYMRVFKIVKRKHIKNKARNLFTTRMCLNLMMNAYH